MARSVATALALIASTNLALACGKERWPVKTGTDGDASQISMHHQSATIAQLRKIKAPANPDSRRDTRFTPTEFRTFQISGKLVVIKKEADQDYHLVIQDGRQKMIIESVDPKCAAGSIFLTQIRDVRQAIDGKLGPIAGKKRPNVMVTVTGVAFFDPIHGQEGVAPNGIELHPILAIGFH